MATIADELENDFADSGSEGEGFDNENVDAGLEEGAVTDDEAQDDEIQETEDMSGVSVMEADEEREARIKRQKKEPNTSRDVKTVGHFMQTLEPVLEKITYYKSLPQNQRSRQDGPVEEDPEYQLLVKSNALSTSIDDYSAEVHKHLRDHYSARFPELETLLSDPLEYTKAVAVIGNGPMQNLQPLVSGSDNLLGQPLTNILTRPKLMTVTVEATTTKGRELPEHELQMVQEDCKYMLQLEKAKRILTQYVESCMNLFAPNLTILIGSLTGARMLNARGGLTALANTRASNIPSIGTTRAAHSGFATNVGVRNEGFLFQSELVQRFRPEHRKQAMRIISAKIVLAARIDRVHESKDGHMGEDLREQCAKRLDKLVEPPPNKGARALAAPDERPSKKRGGRRARKAKEAVAMTDLRRAQNRMKFGEEERETGFGTGDSTAGMGMIGQSNDGRIRAMQVDNRTRAKLSKKNPGWGGSTNVNGAASSLRGFGLAGHSTSLNKGLRTSGVATNAGGGGTESSLNFNAKQGLELVDPKVRADLERKAKAEQDRWFKGGTFTQLGAASTLQNKTGGNANGEFKKPELPMKRKLGS